MEKNVQKCLWTPIFKLKLCNNGNNQFNIVLIPHRQMYKKCRQNVQKNIQNCHQAHENTRENKAVASCCNWDNDTVTW